MIEIHRINKLITTINSAEHDAPYYSSIQTPSDTSIFPNRYVF